MNRRDLLKSLAAFPLVGWMFGETVRAVEVVPDASWAIPPVIQEPTKYTHHWQMSKIRNISWEIVAATIDGIPQAFHLCKVRHRDCKGERFVLRDPLVGDPPDRWVKVGWRSDELTEEIREELFHCGIRWEEMKPLISAYADEFSKRYPISASLIGC